MVPTGGRWGSITRLRDQTARLFASTVSANYQDKRSQTEAGFRLADRSTLWWDAKTPEQAGLWESSVKLSETFYNEIIAHPIPVDMRAIRALKKSPLALDIYAWMTYRASYATKPSEDPLAGAGHAVRLGLRAVAGLQGGIPGRAAEGSHGLCGGEFRAGRARPDRQANPNTHQPEGRRFVMCVTANCL